MKTINSTLNIHKLLQLSACVFCKDIEGRYLRCNSVMQQWFQFENAEDCIGYDDRDLGLDYAEEFQAHDVAAMKQNKVIIKIEKINLALESQPNLSIVLKSPLFSESNRLLGTVGIAIIGNTNTRFLQAITEEMSAHIPTRRPHTFQLSKAEKRCLNLFARNSCTNKEIAEMMCVSSRTVEAYFESIKTKLNCRNRSQIMKAAILQNLVDLELI